MSQAAFGGKHKQRVDSLEMIASAFASCSVQFKNTFNKARQMKQTLRVSGKHGKVRAFSGEAAIMKILEDGWMDIMSVPFGAGAVGCATELLLLYTAQCPA